MLKTPRTQLTRQRSVEKDQYNRIPYPYNNTKEAPKISDFQTLQSNRPAEPQEDFSCEREPESSKSTVPMGNFPAIWKEEDHSREIEVKECDEVRLDSLIDLKGSLVNSYMNKHQSILKHKKGVESIDENEELMIMKKLNEDWINIKDSVGS